MYLNKHDLEPVIAFFGLDFGGNMFIIKIYDDDSVEYEEIGV